MLTKYKMGWQKSSTKCADKWVDKNCQQNVQTKVLTKCIDKTIFLFLGVLLSYQIPELRPLTWRSVKANLPREWRQIMLFLTMHSEVSSEILWNCVVHYILSRFNEFPYWLEYLNLEIWFFFVNSEHVSLNNTFRGKLI